MKPTLRISLLLVGLAVVCHAQIARFEHIIAVFQEGADIYVDNSTGTITVLKLATSYGWANYMFQTNQGPSFPAHQFIFGGSSALSAREDLPGTFISENCIR